MQFEAGQSVTRFLDLVLWVWGENYLLHEVVIFIQMSWVESVTSWSCLKSLSDTLSCSQSLSASQGFLSLQLDSYRRIEMEETTLQPWFCLLLTVLANVPFLSQGSFFLMSFPEDEISGNIIIMAEIEILQLGITHN